MRKHYVSYFIIVSLFAIGIYFVLLVGAKLPSAATPSPTAYSESLRGEPENGTLFTEFVHNLRSPISILMLQIVVIVSLALGLGGLFRRIGQPAVIGEMVAGILLGPSLFGWLAPAANLYLFPIQSLATLHLLAQIGIALFMFLVGMELDVQLLRKKSHTAVLISHASIVIPFFLGVTTALALYHLTPDVTTSFSAFALFMGVAMSITAFPVLARIIQERGISRTTLGSMIITCAAVDDVTAWCLLALVFAMTGVNGFLGAGVAILLALLFIGVMLFGVRPLAARLLGEETTSRSAIVGVLLFVLTSALLTEVLGIHALFGAFLAGVVMPNSPVLRTYVSERLETFVILLLPLFFAYTGLRTQIGLLNDWESWAICLGIIAVAVAGKLGGSMLAARWTGMSWLDSFIIGACMNTRGLIELVVLNIGYDLGILPARIFTMMVIMALVTTFMTGPLLQAAEHWKKRRQPLQLLPKPMS